MIKKKEKTKQKSERKKENNQGNMSDPREEGGETKKMVEKVKVSSSVTDKHTI